ncbi:MAG: diguanylate cyclase [Candidatus Lernaella stagnicola]|nr:diguanylate cyclase [Candidatus Lernaella stagnicola]
MAAITARGANVKVPYTDVHFTMDTPFIFTVLMIYGPLPAMFADALAKVINTSPHINRVTWYKLPFNVASGVLSVFAANLIFFGMLPENPQYVQYIVPMLALATAYFFVNSFTVAIAIAISTRGHLIKLWLDNFLWTGVGFFVAMSIALVMYLLHFWIGFLSFLVSVPIIMLVYTLQKSHEKREEDSRSYIAQLESMHMSTIETLSLAIDAKDQITHGHVHRVTAYVTRLAEFLGVEDPDELKGLRFAALVHDIGKIGIPDLILSKPGRFSSEEMDRMKMHPVIGSQIVKAVSTDFPISDVVLSHHERWDGTGYPHRLHGEQINRFARMLAICDVYDALRSDRPYRRAMDRDTAIGIIREGRGTSFDPEITDMFLDNLGELERSVEEENRRLQEMTFSTPSSTDSVGGDAYNSLELYGQITYTQQEVFLLYEAAQMIGTSMPADMLAHNLITKAAKLIPYNTAILFVADPKDEVLRPLFVDSRDAGAFADLQIKFGGGVSGWVAIHNHPMRNVDPQVELCDVPAQEQTYMSVLSVPMRFDDRPVGVITLYSEKKDFYQERHQDLLAKLASMVTPAIVSSLRADEDMDQETIDTLTGLGNGRAMRRYFESKLAGHQQLDPYTLVLIELNSFRQITKLYGYEVGEQVMKELAGSVKTVLRPEDRCFRVGADELVLIAHGADVVGAEVVARRLRQAVRRLGVRVAGGILSPQLSIGFASYPQDGIHPEQLWRTADGVLYRDRIRQGSVLTEETDTEDDSGETRRLAGQRGKPTFRRLVPAGSEE